MFESKIHIANSAAGVHERCEPQFGWLSRGRLARKIRIGVGVRGVLFGSFLDKQKGTLIKKKISFH